VKYSDAEPETPADDGEPEIEDENQDDGGPKTRKAPAAPKYTFMSEFNLAPVGVPSLKEYCTKKNPQTESDKFLVASAWIMTHGGADPFTGATCSPFSGRWSGRLKWI
jgi:hypothetical protein